MLRSKKDPGRNGTLYKIACYEDLDPAKLMEVYAESNLENTDYFYPDVTDKTEAVRMVEAGFLDFLQNEFFARPGSVYWVLEKKGIWMSAVRTTKIRDGLYYLEALETRPDHRKKGYGAKLLCGISDALKEEGPFRLCDCVSKKNTASIKTHLKCGFRIRSEEGYDYLRNEADDRDYGMEYHWPEN